jgi:glycine/D-amino acid oxidase-like deaminating enzyme
MSEMADEETPGERLEAALEMWEDGIAIMRANLRRRMPKATDDEVEAALDAWLCNRPPDADGVPVPWPRHR